MSNIFMLFAAPTSSSGPLDPGTLSPAEHYKEDSWSAKEWQDSIGAAVWNQGEGAWQTGTTKNSLLCYSGSGSGSLWSNHATIPHSSFENTEDLETRDPNYWTLILAGKTGSNKSLNGYERANIDVYPDCITTNINSLNIIK